MTRTRRVKFNPRFIVTVLIVVAAVIIFFMTPIFKIKDVTVSGNSRIGTTEIMLASGIREDGNIFAISKGKAIEKIKALGYIEEVKISRQLPGKVKITVKEAEIACYLEYGGGLLGISESGQALCLIDKASESLGAPRVSGLFVIQGVVGSKIVLKSGMTDEYDTLMKFLETFKEKGISDHITSIDVSDSDYVVFKHLDKLKVEFGGMEDYDLKFNYFAAMIKEMGEDMEGVLNMVSENYAYSHTIE